MGLDSDVNRSHGEPGSRPDTGFAGLLRHGLTYAAGIVASRAIGFLMIPVYTRVLPPQTYGVIELLSRMVEILGYMMAIGMSASLMRFYKQYNDARSQRQVLSTGLVFGSVVGGGLTVLLIGLSGHLAGWVLGSRSYAWLAIVALLVNWLELVLLVPLTLLRAREQSALYSAVSVGRLLAGLGLNIYLIVILRLGAAGVFYSWLVTDLLAALVLCVYCVRETGVSFSWTKFKPMFWFGLPLVPAVLASCVLNFGDRFVLNKLVGLGDVGVYSLGYRFATLVSVLVAQPFMLIWTSRMYEIAERPNGPLIVARVMTYFALGLAAAALVLSVSVYDIIRVMAAPAFRGAALVVPVVAIGIVCFGLGHVPQLGMLLHNRTGYMPLVNGGAAALNIGLNFLLIPRIGIMGAAWATAAAYAVQLAAFVAVGQRLYPIPYEYGRLVRLLIWCGSIYAMACAVPLHPLALSAGLKALLIVVSPVGLWALGFFTADEVRATRQWASSTGAALKAVLDRP